MCRRALPPGWPCHFQEQTGKRAQCPAQRSRKKNSRHHCHFCSCTKPGTWLANPGAWLKPIYRRAKQQLPSASGSSLFHFLVPLSVVSDPFPVHELPPASVAISAYVGHEGQAAEDTDFQARVYSLFLPVCEAALGQQQCQQKGADDEKIHVGRCSLEGNRPTKPITSEEVYQKEKSHKPLGTDGTLPLAPGSLPASPLSP